MKEGKFYMNLAQGVGANIRVSDTVLCSIGRNYEGSCDLYNVDAEVCLHSGTCTCTAYYIKKNFYAVI